jgi:hypothetical protein
MDWTPDAPVPDPSDSPSYDGLNDQLLAQRREAAEQTVLGGVRHERDVLKLTQIINDHAPVQYNRYLPHVKCATPACNFEGEFWAHSEHVARLIMKALKR